MDEQIFNATDMPWMDSPQGKTKILVGDEFSKSSRLRLFCLEPGKSFEGHEHDFTQCMYFTSGRGTVSIDDHVVAIVPGLTVIVLPKQCHSINNTGNENIEIIVFETHDNSIQDNPFVDF